MKITVEHYNETVSIETKHDDITFDEFMEMQKRIALAIYDAKTVEDYWK